MTISRVNRGSELWVDIGMESDKAFAVAVTRSEQFEAWNLFLLADKPAAEHLRVEKSSVRHFGICFNADDDRAKFVTAFAAASNMRTDALNIYEGQNEAIRFEAGRVVTPGQRIYSPPLSPVSTRTSNSQ